MKINLNHNLNSNNAINPLGTDNNKGGKTVLNFANSNIGKNGVTNTVEQKKEAARKQAMKLMSDAFEGEQKADGMMDSQRDRFKELQNEYGNLKKQLKDLKEKGLPEEATDDDVKAYNESLKEYTLQADAALTEMRSIDQSLRSTKIERLKTDPIGDAFDEAENIMEAAREEIIGSLTSDAKEYIDEKQKKKPKRSKKRKKNSKKGSKRQRKREKNRKNSPKPSSNQQTI
ncbi:MAG: hypothetical protein K6A38_07465 [Lachnospiraceae bacterium]|nr:hypothetical protein [Lachnospiraceae bacterium]